MWNIWRRGWVLPIIAVGLWAFVSLVIGTIVPVVYQQFVVQPNELQKERPYIQRNIHATRDAFGLDKVAVASFPYKRTSRRSRSTDNSTTIENARLWDPPVILRNFQLFQALQTFYKFADADVDRYVDRRQAPADAHRAARAQPGRPAEPDLGQPPPRVHARVRRGRLAEQLGEHRRPAELPAERHPAARATSRSTGPRCTSARTSPGFSLVDAKTREFNYPQKGASNDFTRYTGEGGVELSSWLRRAAFALRFNDFNVLISGQITPKTKVLYLRDILDRVKKAAPFLHYDADPYPVIANGRLVWMLDGYTTSDKYPYSQSFSGDGRAVRARSTTCATR